MSAPRWSDDRTQALMRLWEADLSFGKMASRLSEMFGEDISRSAVAGQMRRLGRKKMKAAEPAEERKPEPPKPPAPKPVKAAGGPGRLLPIRPKTKPLPGSPRGCEPPTVPLPLMLRRPHQCGWPVNDGGPFLFCALPKAAGDRHYCGYHRQLSLPRDGRRRNAA